MDSICLKVNANKFLNPIKTTFWWMSLFSSQSGYQSARILISNLSRSTNSLCRLKTSSRSSHVLIDQSVNTISKYLFRICKKLMKNCQTQQMETIPSNNKLFGNLVFEKTNFKSKTKISSSLRCQTWPNFCRDNLDLIWSGKMSLFSLQSNKKKFQLFLFLKDRNGRQSWD